MEDTPEAKSHTVGDPLVHIRDLTVVYDTERGPIEAVRGVNLDLYRGESYGLVGESGSGKSTLAMGLLRYLAGNGRIARGAVSFDGIDLASLSTGEMRRIWGARIAMVYQNPGTALNPSLKVGRQLSETVRRHSNEGGKEAWSRVLEMLERVRMPDPEAVADRYPHQLSGGMVQRCVIAMALLTSPDLLIMDEPTTALDVTTQAVVLDLVAELKDELDSAILYITHDLGVVARICDRIGVLYAGEFVEQAATRSLYDHPLHPYSLDLLGCVPRLEEEASRRTLVTIPGSIPRPDELPAACIFSPRCRFVRSICREKKPPLEEVRSGRLSACWRWKIVPRPENYFSRETEDFVVPTARDERVFEVRDLSKRFPGPRRGPVWRRGSDRRVRALDGVTMWVNEGRTLGLVGESGCGKTTLARLISGLLEPSTGEMLLQGRPLPYGTRRRSRSVLKAVQMVFQDPDSSLNPHHSVGQAVRRPLSLLKGTSRKEAARRAVRLLDTVSLPAEYYHRNPGSLSGGEKQRVALARAFAADPELILCDEPISSLDVSVQGTLMNLLMRLQAERGTSYLFISHDLAAVQHLSDWIAVLYLGKVMEWGNAREVLSPPYHPYTEALISAVPVPDPGVTQRRVRLRGSVPSALEPPSGCVFHTRCPRYIGEICWAKEPPWRRGEGDLGICCHIPLEELAQKQEGTFERRVQREE